MDTARLQLIQSVIDSAVAENKIAGLNVMVMKDASLAGYWQSGYADVEKKQAFTKDTICRMFSMTKPVTSVAAMLLLEEGKLDLNEELWHFIPAFKDLKISYGEGRASPVQKANRPILIQDLLNMTSGYTYGAWSEDSPLGEHLTSDLIAELNNDEAENGPNKITTREIFT